MTKLEGDNSDLQQSLLQRVRSLEADQRKQVEDGLRVRSSLDRYRYRQDLTQLDTEKREMAQQITEAKTKDKKM